MFSLRARRNAVREEGYDRGESGADIEARWRARWPKQVFAKEKQNVRAFALPAGSASAIPHLKIPFQPTSGGPSQLGASDAPVAPCGKAEAVPGAAQRRCRWRRGR